MANIAEMRATVREQLRVAGLMALTPPGERVLEIGARDCFLTKKLTSLYKEVVALDLEKPEVDIPGVIPVKGDVTALDFPDDSFDTVFCTEVLEHIDPALLQQACDGIARVAKKYAVIGVPFRQDLRVDRTRCAACGGVNPTTGHLSSFDRDKPEKLFAGKMRAVEVHYVGFGARRTNPVSTWLFGLCGYPYGTYGQEEGCVHCGEKLVLPHITPLKWAVCFAARALDFIQNKVFSQPARKRPNWIHILFEKA